MIGRILGKFSVFVVVMLLFEGEGVGEVLDDFPGEMLLINPIFLLQIGIVNFVQLFLPDFGHLLLDFCCRDIRIEVDRWHFERDRSDISRLTSQTHGFGC